jgi:hypothetical protein
VKVNAADDDFSPSADAKGGVVVRVLFTQKRVDDPPHVVWDVKSRNVCQGHGGRVRVSD